MNLMVSGRFRWFFDNSSTSFFHVWDAAFRGSGAENGVCWGYYASSGRRWPLGISRIANVSRSSAGADRGRFVCDSVFLGHIGKFGEKIVKKSATRNTLRGWSPRI
jgi:hypothetical protein